MPRSPRLLLLTCVILLPAGLTKAEPIVDEAALRDIGLVKYWEARIPLADNDRIEQAYLVDEALYVVTRRGTVFALVAEVGLIRWGSKITAEDYVIFRPTHLFDSTGTGPVAIRTTDRLYVFDRYEGRIIHSSRPDFPVGSAAVGVDDLIFAGSADGRFYASTMNCTQPNRLARVWMVQADGPITAAPALYGGNKLLFASQGGTVYSCVAIDKTLVWRFKTDGAILADPVVDVDGVYVASEDQSLYKIDGNTGRLLWRHRTPSALNTPPAVAGDTVYQFCTGLGLVAIDTGTGRALWTSAQGRSLAARVGDRDFVFTQANRLQAIEHKSGHTIGDIPTVGTVGAVVNTQHDSVYLLGENGTVFCARPIGASHLRPREVSAARRSMNSPPPARAGSGAERAAVDSTTVDRDSDPFRSRRSP